MDMKDLRRKAGLRAEEVAVQLDIAVSTVRNWEQGRTIPRLRLDQIAELCKIYKVSFDELVAASRETVASSARTS